LLVIFTACLGVVAGEMELLSVLQEWTEPNNFHICITSYKQFFRGYTAFSRVHWKCLVVDEMQRVKGMTERHWEAIFKLQRSDCTQVFCLQISSCSYLKIH
jgi:E1A-binding protein p400